MHTWSLTTMHTWSLICALKIASGDCNLETADRWFEVAPKARHHIRQSIAKRGIFNPKTHYIKVFDCGGSLGY